MIQRAPAWRVASLVTVISLASIALPSESMANTSHHSGGGGGGGSSGTCLRWEPLPGLVTPDGGSDGGTASMDLGAEAPTDGGSDMAANSHAGERCVEYASLFGCSMGSADRAAASSAAAPSGVLLMLGMAGLVALGRSLRRAHERS